MRPRRTRGPARCSGRGTWARSGTRTAPTPSVAATAAAGAFHAPDTPRGARTGNPCAVRGDSGLDAVARPRGGDEKGRVLHAAGACGGARPCSPRAAASPRPPRPMPAPRSGRRRRADRGDAGAPAGGGGVARRARRAVASAGARHAVSAGAVPRADAQVVQAHGARSRGAVSLRWGRGKGSTVCVARQNH